MNNQLYIPKKIKVGYQKRNDTYTNKLAYIIYYDDKGKLRKETSWENWRNKNIAPEEFDNVPTSGFTLNKDVKRSSEWFGDGRNMIRVYDERGIEFEITTGNLIFILMTTNCNKRGLEGEFVYAWYGKELVLLPTGCEEYKSSVDFTNLQKEKISAKSLKPGYSYKTKKDKILNYLGRFDWYSFVWNIKYNYRGNNDNRFEFQKVNKYYVFTNERGDFEPLLGLTSLATEVSKMPTENFANDLEKFTKSKFSAPVVDIVTKPIKIEKPTTNSNYYFNKNYILQTAEDEYTEYSIYIDKKPVYDFKTKIQKTDFNGYILIPYRIITFKNKELIRKHVENRYDILNHHKALQKHYQFYELNQFNWLELFLITKNKSSIKLETF